MWTLWEHGLPYLRKILKTGPSSDAETAGVCVKVLFEIDYGFETFCTYTNLCFQSGHESGFSQVLDSPRDARCHLRLVPKTELQDMRKRAKEKNNSNESTRCEPATLVTFPRKSILPDGKDTDAKRCGLNSIL